MGKVAPYGYRKSLENKHRLEVDPIAAAIVAEIFELFLQGRGCHQIARTLSERAVPTPARHNNIAVGRPGASYGLWSHTAIRRILRNEIYTGTLVQNKYKKLNYKSNKQLKTDESAWLRSPNAHEAIISQEIFDKAGQLLEATASLRPSKHRYLLSGLLKCGGCGSYISLTKKDKKYGQVYGRCGRYIQYHRFGLCTPHSFNYSKLEEKVINMLRDLCRKYFDHNAMGEMLGKAKSGKSAVQAKAKQIEGELVRLENRLNMLYDDRLNGVITLESYKSLSQKAATDCEALKEQLTALKDGPDRVQSKKEWGKIVKEFVALTTPTQALLAQLIEKIDVKEGNEFDVHFVFKEFGNKEL